MTIRPSEVALYLFVAMGCSDPSTGSPLAEAGDARRDKNPMSADFESGDAVVGDAGKGRDRQLDERDHLSPVSDFRIIVSSDFRSTDGPPVEADGGSNVPMHLPACEGDVAAATLLNVVVEAAVADFDGVAQVSESGRGWVRFSVETSNGPGLVEVDGDVATVSELGLGDLRLAFHKHRRDDSVPVGASFWRVDSLVAAIYAGSMEDFQLMKTSDVVLGSLDPLFNPVCAAGTEHICLRDPHLTIFDMTIEQAPGGPRTLHPGQTEVVTVSEAEAKLHLSTAEIIGGEPTDDCFDLFPGQVFRFEAIPAN